MQRRYGFGICVLAGLLSTGTEVEAQGGLKTINPPSGGQVVYGTIDGNRTPQTAMAFMLKQVHGHFGDRPQVSNIFQIRGSDSYAAFFTLIAKTEGAKPVAGEVIVSVPKGQQPTAAVLYDDAQRFTKSQPVLLKALSTATQPPAPARAAQGQPPPTKVMLGAVPALHVQSGGDHSASLALPDGWRVLSVGGGSISAEGPNGERIGLGLMAQGIRDPRVPVPPYMPKSAAGGIVCPSGGDLFNAYVCVVNQQRRNAKQPAATFKLTSSRPLPGGAVEAIFEVDLHDGKGPREASARIQEIVTRGLASWAMMLSNSSVPKTVSAAEGPMMTAIIGSYRQDTRIVGAEQKRAIDQIHAIGARAKAQAEAADQRRVASEWAFEAHMDNIDRQSKAMQNYTLDRSQIQDNDRNGRATVSNGLADALVKSDPNRFQVVPSSNFLKGVDY